MGRAIVRDPKVFLFDEPLSNLDAKLRVAMRAEIKALHQRLKTTTVYVTHDQVEAMTMADRIVVMHDGRIEQIGTPLELYDQPGNLFVAQFIGSPAMNVVDGTVRRANGRALRRGGGRRALAAVGGAGSDGQAVAYGIRPEHLTLGGAGDDGGPGGNRRGRADRRRDRAADPGGRRAGDPAHARAAGGESRRQDRARRRPGARPRLRPEERAAPRRVKRLRRNPVFVLARADDVIR